MKCLPPAPERKLLTDYVEIAPQSGEKVSMVEHWYENGIVAIWVNGRLVEIRNSLYWHGKPPFVRFNCVASPWEREQ